MPVFTTACPRNCYSTCSMRVHVEDGRIRRIEPHPDNRATPEGVCLKGLSYFERVVSPDRLQHPLRRRRGGDEFERVSWESALEEIAERLVRIREESGPQAVLYYSASGTKGLLNRVGSAFWRLYGGCTTTYGDLCWPAGLEATRLTLGDNKHSAPWDLANAKLIVMWGRNAAETNIHQMPFVEQSLANGGRLVVIDPRRTQTAERADLLVRPRPGTDGAIALAVAHELAAHAWIDRAFIERHVLGYAQFAERVGACTPEWAAAIAEVSVEQIRRLAEWIGTCGPVTICPGFGMQRYTNSGQTMRAMLALLAITGNLGRPGAGWVYANLQSHIFDTVKDPIAFFPPEVPDGVMRVSISTARLGRDMLAQRDPPLRMAWVERGNPIPQNPETNTVLEAFRHLEFRVVIDQFLTDTAREADLVLPAKTMFEQSDVIGAYWHPYLQLKQKVLDPPGEVKPESEVYWLLAHRLGFEDGAIRAALPEPSDAGVEAYLREHLAPFEGLTLERLRDGPQLPPGHQEVAFSDFVFPTPSGKVELLSAEAEARWGSDPLPAYAEPEESVRSDTPQAQRYPLYFMTPNTKNRIHSQFNNLAMIRAVSPGPLVTIHPDDAASRGIRDGDVVRIFNDRGALEVPAQLDAGIRAGCVAVTNGWWITDGGAVNVCSLGRETDMGYGAAFHDNLVDVRRAG
ncbi:MAG: molybdopterin-dependent oxidoreductase [Gemmatimonadales bacterium]|nr:molybdopterin-dependent oxidoreductase [Gemmatimonadales bacterium]